MSTLRLLAVAFALVGAASLAVGAAGFSDVSAERGVQISVVDDDEAYVGVQACHKQSAGGTGNSDGGSATPVRVEVTNRYAGPFVVESIESDEGETVADDGEHVGAGDSERFELTFDGEVSTVTVDASADGFEASVTQTVVPKDECPFDAGAPSGTTTEGTGTPDGDSSQEDAGANETETDGNS